MLATRSRLLVVVLLIIALTSYTVSLASAAPTAVLIIDDFSTNQARLNATLGAPQSSSASGGGILGTERDIRTTTTADPVGGGSITSSEVTGHSITHSQDSGVIGNTLVQWDGVDGSLALNPTGLGIVDLTQGNTQNGLVIEVILNDLPINLIFTVYSDGANSSQAMVSLPGGQPSGSGSRYYYLEYASFTPLAGAGASFDNVGAVEMLIDGINDATDLTIHDIRTMEFDWGDLPDDSVGGPNYATRFVANGPRHVIGDLTLGTLIDPFELNGVPSAGATGDDTSGSDDEDGVVRTAGVNWTSGAGGGSVDVTVTGGAACLSAWIDWDGNGNLTGTGENILSNVALAAGTSTQTFFIPVDPAGGTFYARFRLYPQDAGGVCTTARSPTGLVVNGEVEDYQWGFGPNAVSLRSFSGSAAPVSLPMVGVVVATTLALLAAGVRRALHG